MTTPATYPAYKTITFQYQGPSVTNWQAVGPGGIDTTGVTANNNFTDAQYNSVVGRINAVLTDPQDPTGDTYLTAGDNGGIWRTTDGGVDWTPETDYVIDPTTGSPIDVPIGAMGGAVNLTTNQFIIYAGMGDSDIEPDARRRQRHPRFNQRRRDLGSGRQQRYGPGQCPYQWHCR